MADTIRFLMGGEEHRLAGVAPTLTILQYLRRHARRCGTKEGCAEGDCGACTVVLSEPDGAGGLRHRAVNSCIQFVPALDGRQLTTVEDLRAPGGELHAVQQALVDLHGSQCGFCTPGFVMQIYAGWLQGQLTDRRAAKDWIAGNLCRCTGYGPIVDAALSAGKARAPDPADDAGTVARLGELGDGSTLELVHGEQRYLAPRTADAFAEAYLAHPDAVVLAGATDVGLWVTKQHRTLATLIDITRVAELARIGEASDALTLGAAVSHRDATAALARLHPDLGELMRRFAAIQIRNCGTVGGNIANGSPIGDLPPALIALGAELTLRRGDVRRTLPLEDFFIAYGRQDRQPGEFVESVRVPRLKAGTRFACYKLTKRFDSDISAVLAAICVSLDGGRVSRARIAFGGMAATPRRAAAAEAALVGNPLEAGLAAACDALADDFTPLTDMRASAGYRLAAAQNLLRRFALENAGDRPATRVLELADG